MSFIPKNPLSIPEIKDTPSSLPMQGTRGLFAKNDGWYDVDSKGNVEKIATSNDLVAQSATHILCSSDATNTKNAVVSFDLLQTIQSMFDENKIKPLDTIIIREGTYYGANGNITIKTPCTIVSANQNGITSNNDSYVFSSVIIESDNVVLDSISCRMLVVNSNNCIIRNCRIYSDLIINGSYNKILDNYQLYGKIIFGDQSNTDININTIEGNVIYGNRNNNGFSMPIYENANDYILGDNDIELVKNSDLVSKEEIVGHNSGEGGEIFNDYENNEALAPKTSVSGSHNIAGAKAFTITGVDVANDYNNAITSVDDLKALATAVAESTDGLAGQRYTLTTDLDLGGETWTDYIGTYKMHFKGIFDGKGHVIKNFKVKNDGVASKRYGLFAYVSGDAIIKNLGIENFSMYRGYDNVTYSKGAVGALVADVSGNAKITSCYAKNVEIACKSVDDVPAWLSWSSWWGDQIGNAGALVGLLNGEGVVVENCYAIGYVETNDSASSNGGLIGSGNLFSRVENCYSDTILIDVSTNNNVKVINSYAVQAGGWGSNGTKGGVAKTADELKTMADVLGSAYDYDNKVDALNDGFPMLLWEETPIVYWSFVLDDIDGLTAGTELDRSTYVSTHVMYKYIDDNGEEKTASIQNENFGYIIEINPTNNSVIVNTIPEDLKEKLTVGTRYLGFTIDPNGYIDNGFDSEVNTFRITDDPTLGTRSIGYTANSKGYKNKSTSKGASSNGCDNNSYGSWSNTINKGNRASYCADAGGSNTSADGHCSFTRGDKVKVKGYGAGGVGVNLQVDDMASFITGQDTISTAKQTFGWGYKQFIHGICAAAGGILNTVKATCGFIIGRQNTIEKDADSAFVGGKQSLAKGIQSFVFALKGVANAAYTVVFGVGTIASSISQFVRGKYNIEDTENKYADIVGNGETDNARSNAYTLDWNGNGWFAGDVTVGKDNLKLATEKDVDNAVARLVDSAPDTLDTLNELAEALGEDKNFATTVTTKLGGKVDKVDGKGLSTNDYTTAEKEKLANLFNTAQSATYIIASEDTPNNAGCIITNDYAQAITDLLAREDYVVGSEIVIRQGEYTSVGAPLNITKSCHIRTEGHWKASYAWVFMGASNTIVEDAFSQFVYIFADSCTLNNGNHDVIYIYGGGNFSNINTRITKCFCSSIAMHPSLNNVCAHDNFDMSYVGASPAYKEMVVNTQNTKGNLLPNGYYTDFFSTGAVLPDEFFVSNDIERLKANQIYDAIGNFETAINQAIALCDSYIGGESV